MTLVKSTGNKKVNLDFNKEFINTFSQKIQSNDIQFVNQTPKDLHESDVANLIENLSDETRTKLIEIEDYSQIESIQNKALELSLFLSIPASFALFVSSTPIISALFGYGSFSEASVQNSSSALFFFAFGLPAFALIKVFSSFFFARHDTKTPFYISLASVLLNIFISVILFQKLGFIIIPIATSISSWFNAILLYIFCIKKKFFSFNKNFISRFPRIIFSSIIMGIIFYYLLNIFSEKLMYEESFKIVYLILSILIASISYVIISIFTKAFKISDIKLNYK